MYFRPNLSSNIPIYQVYGTFYSQVIRIFNANNTHELFINNINALIEKLCNQGFNCDVCISAHTLFVSLETPLCSPETI